MTFLKLVGRLYLLSDINKFHRILIISISEFILNSFFLPDFCSMIKLCARNTFKILRIFDFDIFRCSDSSVNPKDRYGFEVKNLNTFIVFFVAIRSRLNCSLFSTIRSNNRITLYKIFVCWLSLFFRHLSALRDLGGKELESCITHISYMCSHVFFVFL